MWGAGQLAGYRGDADLPSGCCRSRRAAVLALPFPCGRTEWLQQPLLQLPWAQATVPLLTSAACGEGAPGSEFPTSGTLPLPSPGVLAPHPASCLVGWLGRLLNELLFTGFSSARLANRLIP